MMVALDLVVYLREMLKYDQRRLDALSMRLEAVKPKEK